MNSKLFLISISGNDNPGITSTLMTIISKYETEILDMGQAITHNLLSLSFLIKFLNNDPTSLDDHPAVECLKDLLFISNKLNLHLTYNEVEKQSYTKPKLEQKFVLNCVSTRKNLSPKFVAKLSSMLAQNNINIQRIDNLTRDNFKSLEIITNITNETNFSKLKIDLLKLGSAFSIDIAFLKDNIFRRSKRLICFDMDSTLIQTEVINEMAEVMGVGEEIKKITERAMNGEINFSQSLEKRVRKLKGLKVSQMEEIYQNLKLTDGCFEFIQTVKKLGYKVALISGGFSFFANKLKQHLGLDYAFANKLEIVNNQITGNLEGTIVDASQKAMLLKLISQQEKISLEQVVAIGDGANDLPMLDAAGLGIAYHAKDIVRQQASHHLTHGPMTTILYFLGISEIEH